MARTRKFSVDPYKKLAAGIFSDTCRLLTCPNRTDEAIAREAGFGSAREAALHFLSSEWCAMLLQALDRDPRKAVQGLLDSTVGPRTYRVYDRYTAEMEGIQWQGDGVLMILPAQKDVEIILEVKDDEIVIEIMCP